MPDGSFNITQDGLEAQLTGDATGTANCSTPISMDLWGQVDCTGSTPRDQAKVRFETVMWLNKVPQGATAPHSQPQCTLPAAKCYFHAISSVNQCN
jgi:hypothetical protein